MLRLPGLRVPPEKRTKSRLEVSNSDMANSYAGVSVGCQNLPAYHVPDKDFREIVPDLRMPPTTFQDLKMAVRSLRRGSAPMRGSDALVFATSSRNHVTSEEYANVIGPSYTKVYYRTKAVIDIFSYLSTRKTPISIAI